MDDTDIFAISSIIVFALALALVSFLPFDVWVAGVVALIIPLSVMGFALVMAKVGSVQRREAAKPSGKLTGEALDVEPAATDFSRSWLQKRPTCPSLHRLDARREAPETSTPKWAV